MIQLAKLKPRGDYAYEEGIHMVWTAWTRPRCCFNSDFCRTKGSGIHFVVLVVGIKSNLAYILIFRLLFFPLSWSAGGLLKGNGNFQFI